MSDYIFRLREYMPRGFRKNDRYPELPAAVAFLGPYDSHEFKSPTIFQIILDKFPKYLQENKVPKGSDKALRAGLRLEIAEFEGVLNVVTKSDENRSGTCWFGSFGSEKEIAGYFDAQTDARRREIVENYD